MLSAHERVQPAPSPAIQPFGSTTLSSGVTTTRQTTWILVSSGVALLLALCTFSADRIRFRKGGQRCAVFFRCLFAASALTTLWPGVDIILSLLRVQHSRHPDPTLATPNADLWTWRVVARALANVSNETLFLPKRDILGVGRHLMHPSQDTVANFTAQTNRTQILSQTLRLAYHQQKLLWVIALVIFIIATSVLGALISILPDCAPSRRGVYFLSIAQLTIWLAVGLPMSFTNSDPLRTDSSPLVNQWLHDHAYVTYWSQYLPDPNFAEKRFLENWYILPNASQSPNNPPTQITSIIGVQTAFCREFNSLLNTSLTIGQPANSSNGNTKTFTASNVTAATTSPDTTNNIKASARILRATLKQRTMRSPLESKTITMFRENASTRQIHVYQLDAQGSFRPDFSTKTAKHESIHQGSSTRSMLHETTRNQHNNNPDMAVGGASLWGRWISITPTGDGASKFSLSQRKSRDSAVPNHTSVGHSNSNRILGQNMTIKRQVTAYQSISSANGGNVEREAKYNDTLNGSADEVEILNLQLAAEVLLTYFIGKPLRPDIYHGIGYLALPIMTLSPAFVGQFASWWYTWPLVVLWLTAVLGLGLVGTPAILRPAMAPRREPQIVQFCDNDYWILVTDDQSIKTWRIEQAMIGLVVVVTVVRVLTWLWLSDPDLDKGEVIDGILSQHLDSKTEDNSKLTSSRSGMFHEGSHSSENLII